MSSPLPATKPWRDKFHEYDEERENILAAIAAFPTLEEALAFLKESHPKSTLTVKKLDSKRRQFPERLQKMREQLAPELEAVQAANLLDTARAATMATQLAVRAAHEQLAQGRVQDPAKMARDLSQVSAQAIDKRLALQGRPTHITEDKSVDELVRALVGMKVATLEEPVIDATLVEEPADG